MNRETEIKLLRELIDLDSQKKAFLDDSVGYSEVERYTDPNRFLLEQSRIFAQIPQPVIHSSELPIPGSFLRRDIAGLPLLFTRDNDGQTHAFFNVCRHRGTRLVDEHQGCRKKFSCPYHAWTWNNSGKLIGVPHQEKGFPDLNRDTMGLKKLGSAERYGWIWVNPKDQSTPDIDGELQDLAQDFAWFSADDYMLLHSNELTYSANWKILAEGGLEAYHFRIAHQHTIAPYFCDNLSTYQVYGKHIRSVLSKQSISELTLQAKKNWRLRDHAQLLYTLMPSSALLVQSDHISWIRFEPIAVDSTRITINTLVPNNRTELDSDLEHWEKNHQITVDTLTEDFEIGESIQSGLKSGANHQLTFGRFEGALGRYNDIVESLLS